VTNPQDTLPGHSLSISGITKPALPPVADSEPKNQPVILPPPPEMPPPRRRPIGLILLGAGIGVTVASVLGYRYWQYSSTHQTTDNATVAGHIHQISSKITGTVTDVLVNDNQLVESGQLLVQLDPKDYQSKVQQTQAALLTAQRQASAAQANITLSSETTSGKTSQAQGDIDTAQAAIASAQAAVQAAQAGVPLAQAQVAQADANLQKAQADYNRYNVLYQQGAVPRQQLDTAQAAYNVAQAQKSSALQGVQQATAQLAQAQSGITSAEAKLAASRGGLQQATASGAQTSVNRSQYGAARSAIATAEAALQDAQLQLSYIKITAPTAGRVGRKNVEVGNRIVAGAPLMAIVDQDYWVIANFKETQLGKIRPGQPAEVKLDAISGQTFTGWVDSISPASGAQFSLLPPDNATGNFTKIVQRIPVKIRLDPKSLKEYDSRIAPGMSAEVTVEVQ
jgi:membrane fusion protein, multidrug efflux system